MNKSIFHEYDIRGVVDMDLDSQDAEKIGKGFGTYVYRNGGKKIVVGRDVRLSSPQMKNALVKGLLSVGIGVIDIGEVPTPAVYFAAHNLNVGNGIMVTASHNPPEYNGFKMCHNFSTIYGKEIQKIYQLIMDEDFNREKGGYIDKNITSSYVDYIKKKIKLNRKLKVVVDGGNGTAGNIMPGLLTGLGCDVIKIYCEPDGNFPNHFPDPTVPENLADLKKKVLETKADLGVSFDGDSDRLGVIDEKGDIIWGDKLLILFARDVISRHPKAKIIFEVKCSQSLAEDIEKHGGIPIMWKTGHSLIKDKMRKEKALLAGEMSGHFYFADDYYGYDDAIFACCRLVEILSRSQKKLSEYYSDVPAYFSTPEIRIDCPEEKKFLIVKEIAEHFKKDHKVIDIDGARIIFEDGWGLIRASNTQPVLVSRFEAKTAERLEQIKKIITDKVSEVKSLI
ncbi:MAG: phosphomannomutase/phosphoglucomutase [Elusimicrobia bacterium]|nr:phosphomannomutase/phosphoglucomutase [Elusimicrobiota bacterium]